MFLPFQSIWLGLLLASTRLALGQGSSARYDILRGTHGQSACTLQDTIVGKCPLPSTIRDSSPSSILDRDNTSLFPSLCTCNTIFFNIWSACSYSTGNSTLPNFTQWMQRCNTSSLSVESSTGFSEVPGNLGINVPVWANLNVPGNTSFDIQRAVILSHSTSSRWTTLQIILPVVVPVVITPFFSAIVLYIYQRMRKSSRGGNRRMGCSKGLKRLQLPFHKTTASFHRHGTDWVIEPDDNGLVFGPDVHEFDKNPKAILNSDENPPTKTLSFRISSSPVRLPRPPWKRRPTQIKVMAATPRFRVDDVDKSKCSGETNTKEGWNEFGRMDKVDEAQDSPDDDVEDEETKDLITPVEREMWDPQKVLLISRDRQDFTLASRSSNTTSVNSQIRVISPSVSSTPPNSAKLPESTKPPLSIPIPPPPPSHAAPAPPGFRSLSAAGRPGSNDRDQPLPYFQPSAFLPPIREASPTPSTKVSIRRTPAIRRGSPIPETLSGLRTSPAARPSLNFPGPSNRVPSSYSGLHRTASQGSDFSLSHLSVADGSQEYYNPYTESERDHGASVDSHSDGSFYYSSPEQPLHPVRIPSLSITNPSAFFPAAVRGAGYYPRTYT